MSDRTNENITRDYVDNFSIKEMASTKIAPAYFSGQDDLSDLTIGAKGYVTEIISDGLEDCFNTTSVLYQESFPNLANLPSSIYSYAALYQLTDGLASASTVSTLIIMNQDYIINNLEYKKGKYYFYIDKNNQIIIEDIPFSYDYDIEIEAIYKESIQDYVFSARYVIDTFTNSVSTINNPYIRISKSGNGYLALHVELRQYIRDIRYEQIIDNSKVNMPTINIPFDDAIAGFDVNYKAPGDSDYNTQMTTLVKNSTPIKQAFCFYSFKDENTLTLSFGTKDGYFQPEFNSEVEVILYRTLGSKGNFKIYNGTNITFNNTNEVYSYNDAYALVAKTLASSTGGADITSLDDLQRLTVENYRTGTIYSTENDIKEYFNNYGIKYGCDCNFVKKRDDLVDRLYSGFLIMRNQDYIYPTNTLYLNTNIGIFTNTLINKYILDAGTLFTYDDKGRGVVIETDAKTEYKELYEEYLSEHDELDEHSYTIYQYLHDNEIKTHYTVFDDELDSLVSKYKFVFTNPFLLSVNKNPNIIGQYLTVTNKQSILDYLGQNADAANHFIATTLKTSRKLEKQKKYTFDISVLPSASSTVEEEAHVSVFNDPSRTRENNLRILLVFKGTDGQEICYTELYPTSISNGDYIFTGYVMTDDHVTNNNKIRLTGNYRNISELDELVVPMSCKCNIYILYKTPGVTNNNFVDIDYTFAEYSWTNLYSTDTDEVILVKPLNMVKSEIAYLDDRLETVTTGDCTISSYPVVKYDMVSNDDRFDYFINSYTDQYLNLEKIIDYLHTSAHIDIKFYNTYGRSTNFIIGDEEVEGEEVIDTVNVSISYYVWLVKDTDQAKAAEELKLYIKSYIESINDTGTNNFYNSNLVRSLESDFAYIHHVKFIGINDYSPKYQTIENRAIDLTTLSKEDRLVYVPEVLVVNLEDIHLTFFEA